MRVYVGATFSRYLEAREVMDALTTAGHAVTHDWTRTAAFGADGHPLPGVEGLPRVEQAAHAEDDLCAVANAELLLILAQQASCGWPVEVGAALAWDIDVWLVAPFKPTVFWALPLVRLFEDVDEPLRRLGAARAAA